MPIFKNWRLENFSGKQVLTNLLYRAITEKTELCSLRLSLRSLRLCVEGTPYLLCEVR
jgi:hypothetical protein